MKNQLALCVAAGLFTAVPAWADEAQPQLSTGDQLSFSIGYNLGSNFKEESLEVNPQMLIQGLEQGLAGKAQTMTEEQVSQALTQFQKDRMAKQLADQKKQQEDNMEKGKAFLAENQKKPEVKTLPSGLQYEVLKEGNGQSPKATDEVVTHYHGTLIDGTVFDSSVERGEPATFRLNQVIKGWTEALQLMKEGAKWRLVLPPELAYGPRGAGGKIGPNETLIFEVELLEIKK